MIARDTGGGRSFAGTSLYCLHDHDAGTADRVAFAFTVRQAINRAAARQKQCDPEIDR